MSGERRDPRTAEPAMEPGAGPEAAAVAPEGEATRTPGRARATPSRATRGARARKSAVRGSRRRPGLAVVIENGHPAHHAAESPEWRAFVGRWLESAGCTVKPAARGDWEVTLSEALKRRWRRQRVRLVFDPLRPTLPRGAWFTAPGSGAGRKILGAALEAPVFAQRTALPRVPGAPDDGLATVCKVRGLAWGPARLGPVHYERRVAFHAVITRWGGLPSQEPWVVLLGEGGACLERVPGERLPDLRVREGLYQIGDEEDSEGRGQWVEWARPHLEALLSERESEWERSVGRLRDDDLGRIGAFFAARIEEEEERVRRRATNGDDPEMERGDATSLKLEWERRAAEVRQRWGMRAEIRLWGLEEWAWPVATLEQEVRAGAMRVRLTSCVDAARGRPGLPECPTCGSEAEMLVRLRGAVRCAACA